MTDSTEKHFYDLAKTFRNGMLTTRVAAGEMRSRPMIVAEIDDAGDIWMMSDAQSEKVDEINKDASVAIVLQTSDKWLSVSGTAEIVRDTAKVTQLFSEPWKVWFPKGPKDDSIVLIRVQPTHGEYWDNAGLSKAKYMFRAAKAYMQGQRPEMDRDLGGKVSLGDNAIH